MVIKNIFSTPKIKAITESVLNLYVLISFLFIAACSTGSKVATKSPRQDTYPKVEKTPTVVPTQEPNSNADSIESPRFGIILGPGSAKSFAHLGVLESLEKARTPIVAVTGLEWGALAAAAYATQGKAYDAQWKMLKLQDKDLPPKRMLAKFVEPGSVATLNSFFEKTFGVATVEQSKKVFGCPVRSIRKGNVNVLSQGPIGEVVKSCLAFPPYFAPNGEWVAHPLGIAESVEFLRAAGANRIILVDVLAGSSLISEQAAREQVPLYLLWLEQQKFLEAYHDQVDDVIIVKTGSIGLSHFEQRRRLVELGLIAGKSAAQRLINKYGF